MKFMISQPMCGKTEDEILEAQTEAIVKLEKLGHDIFGTFFHFDDEKLSEEGVIHRPVYNLAKSLAAMSKCDGVYFCKGWETRRGCQIEHTAASLYGLHILYEDPDIVKNFGLNNRINKEE